MSRSVLRSCDVSRTSSARTSPARTFTFLINFLPTEKALPEAENCPPTKISFLAEKARILWGKELFCLVFVSIESKSFGVAGNSETFQSACRYFMVGTLLSNLIINSKSPRSFSTRPQTIPKVIEGLLHHHPVFSF